MTHRTKIDDAIEHFARGKHAFAASNDESRRNLVVRAVELALFNEPMEYIMGDSIVDLEDFGASMVAASSSLMGHIGAPPPSGRLSLSALLHEIVVGYRERSRQGFLVVNHVDPILALQHSYEIEGAFRETMQRYSDVAVLWIGSNSAIIDICQSDRPFYLSFPIFWLDRPSE